jgi:hypothetical protein
MVQFCQTCGGSGTAKGIPVLYAEIYDRVLSPTEINAVKRRLMEKDIQPPENGQNPVAIWKRER